MATVELPYGKKHLQLQLPDRNLLAVVEPAEVPPLAKPQEAVLEAIRHPVGTPPLRQMVAPGNKVLVIVDDYTRPTPTHQILPPLLQELEAAAPDLQITILIAAGTHRPMTPDEIRAKIGATVAARYPVVNHEAHDESRLVDVGRTKNGTPIRVNRLVMESDLVIGISNVVPHCLAGWSGGAKIVQPGVCSAETTAWTHALAMMSPMPHLGTLDNPMRIEIEEVVKRTRLHFIVNAVINRHTALAHVVAGQPTQSHRRAVELATPIWVVPVPALPDIVVASSYPADMDFWQAAKGLYACEMIVKRGGDIVLAAPCPERIATEEHTTTLRELRGVSSREGRHVAMQRGIKDLAGVNVAVFMARLNELAWVSIFSDGLTDDDLAILGVSRARTMQQGLDRALERQGPDAQVVFITHGGETCPVLRAG